MTTKNVSATPLESDQKQRAGVDRLNKINHVLKIYIVPVAILFLMAGFLLMPAMLTAISNLIELDSHGMREVFRGFGVVGPLVSIFLLVAQSIFAPLPSLVITLANAYVFGWAYGAAITWVGTLLGASVCFGLARLYGRPIVEKMVGKKSIANTYKLFDRYGKYAIIVCRLLPFVPLDPVSYIAGLTNMRFKTFFAVTAAAQIPVLVMYSYFGENLPNVIRVGKLFLLLLFQYPYEQLEY